MIAVRRVLIALSAALAAASTAGCSNRTPTEATFASDDVPPKESVDDDLRNLKIPKNAEEQRSKDQPLGDVSRRYKYLVNGEVLGERQFYKNGRLAEEKIF